MGAHLRPIKVTCDEPGCASAAKESLYNTFNAHLGDFCRRHALRRLKAVQAGERRHDEGATEGGDRVT